MQAAAAAAVKAEMLAQKSLQVAARDLTLYNPRCHHLAEEPQLFPAAAEALLHNDDSMNYRLLGFWLPPLNSSELSLQLAFQAGAVQVAIPQLPSQAYCLHGSFAATKSVCPRAVRAAVAYSRYSGHSICKAADAAWSVEDYRCSRRLQMQ